VQACGRVGRAMRGFQRPWLAGWRVQYTMCVHVVVAASQIFLFFRKQNRTHAPTRDKYNITATNHPAPNLLWVDDDIV
jgi:hypothetical protein